MPTIKGLYGQTWIDLTLQELGDEERLFELADLNNAGVTDEIDLAAVLQVPAFSLDKKRIVNELKVWRPASGKKPIPPGGNLHDQGIEYWRIEYEFQAS
jgi:hypothetical protein